MECSSQLAHGLIPSSVGKEKEFWQEIPQGGPFIKVPGGIYSHCEIDMTWIFKKKSFWNWAQRWGVGGTTIASLTGFHCSCVVRPVIGLFDWLVGFLALSLWYDNIRTASCALFIQENATWQQQWKQNSWVLRYLKLQSVRRELLNHRIDLNWSHFMSNDILGVS